MLYPDLTTAQSALNATWQWPHFSIPELSCRCGRYCAGAYWHDGAFLTALEALRASLSRPLIINSGHRCRRWNAAVGGAARSRHRTIAVDIDLTDQDRFAVKAAARALGFNGIGLGRNFIHLDRRSKPAEWFYAGSVTSWQTS